MRTAYALLGLIWVLVIVAVVYGSHKNFTGGLHTKSIRSSSQLMATTTLILTSPAFDSDASIPPQYTCDAEQASPPLSIAGVPEGTKSFVILVEDPDVPTQIKPDGKYLHWVVFNIPPDKTEIASNESVGTGGANDTGEIGYVGPCPPKEFEPSEHRYIFSLYALDAMLDLKAGASREDVESAMGGHIIGETQLIARYRRI